MGKRRYQQQERSLRRRLQEHQEKIKTEQAKDMPDEGLIRYWKREVQAFEAGIVRVRKRLGRK